MHLPAEESEDLGGDESLSAMTHKGPVVHHWAHKVKIWRDGPLLAQKCRNVGGGVQDGPKAKSS